MKHKGTNHCNTVPILCLYDENMRVLYKDKLNFFPLPETIILLCSEELFGDLQPCEFHRRAVQMRIYGEFSEFLTHNITIKAVDLPERICQYCQEFHPAFLRMESTAS